jgi:hypothetical protein
MEVTAVFAFVASSLWNLKVIDDLHSSDRAHLEDLKNLVEVRPPGGDCLFITLRVETSRDHTPLGPPHELPLDIRHNPGIQSSLVGGQKRILPVLRSTHDVN